MKTIPFLYAFYIITAIASGAVVGLFYVLVQHVYTQTALDASTDAGATRIQMELSWSQNGEDLESRLILNEDNAEQAARSTFLKNLSNMEELGLDTTRIDVPTYFFPDEHSIAGDLDFEHDFTRAADGFNFMFDDNLNPDSIDDNVQGTSTMRETR
ncbi:hypothetical protein RB620_24770 [Paenibacillus sp. LHD-117]|uniref:hypothetical protein n=1 Tax=Paenibacillus sp. LHD-117 TaxID=3071412 RepID=UPI0027E16C7E|nr:hypothetical protein [Paenibacillus sp. LHD-117]MDQ6422651.1 hypothetical protein [Paenibacillus sp. LHD-117]